MIHLDLMLLMPSGKGDDRLRAELFKWVNTNALFKGKSKKMAQWTSIFRKRILRREDFLKSEQEIEKLIRKEWTSFFNLPEKHSSPFALMSNALKEFEKAIQQPNLDLCFTPEIFAKIPTVAGFLPNRGRKKSQMIIFLRWRGQGR